MFFKTGLKPHPKFGQQKNLAATKPSLKELVVAVETKAKELNCNLPYFNIEIKRKPGQDHIFHPSAVVFAQLVVEALSVTGIKDRTFIQSFDPESLEAVRELDSTIPLVFLVANRKSARKNLTCLSFRPEVYSPYYKSVNQDLVAYCKAMGMKLIPWTVNKEKDMSSLLDLGVNGIISDYPDVLIKVIKEKEGYELLK